MKDIRLYIDNLGYFSLHDSAQDIIDKFRDKENIRIDNQGKLTIVRDITNGDTDTNAIIAFVTEDNNTDVQLIDFCMCEISRVHIGRKAYEFSEFKEEFVNTRNAVAFCDKMNKHINPFEINSDCGSVYSENNMECYLNCPMCSEVKHEVLLEKHNTILTCFNGDDNTMVSIERTKGVMKNKKGSNRYGKT